MPNLPQIMSTEVYSRPVNLHLTILRGKSCVLLSSV